MPANEPITLDEKIESLSPEIDTDIRLKLNESLRVLRKAAAIEPVIQCMSPLGLMMMRRLFACAGHSAPSNDSFFSCLARIGHGDGKKEEGLKILPQHFDDLFHTIRFWSNQIGHNVSRDTLAQPFTDKDAEFALDVCLSFLHWFYCEYEGQTNRLSTIYVTQHKTVTDPRFIVKDFNHEFERCEAFSPRSWLFDEIDGRILADESQHCLFLTGPPGVGKSSTFSNWVKSHQSNRVDDSPIHVIAYHFFRYNQQDTLVSSAFIYSLVAQILQAQIPGYAEAVHESLQSAGQNFHTGTLFNLLIVKPLRKVQRPTRATYVIAIDAVDEAVDYEKQCKRDGNKSSDVVDVKSLRNMANSLPDWVKVFFTSRLESSVVSMMPAKLRIVIDPDNGSQRQDIYQYALAELKRTHPDLDLNGRTFEEIAWELQERSEGNFLYINCIIEDIDAISDSSALPYSLPEYFEMYFDNRIGEDSFESLRRYLQILLAISEPISDAFIGHVLDDDADDVRQSFNRLGSFAPVDDDGKRHLMHKSLADWLIASEDNYHSWTISASKGRKCVNDWLDKELSDLGAYSTSTWEKCCVFNGQFTAQTLSNALKENDDIDVEAQFIEMSRRFLVSVDSYLNIENYESPIFSVSIYLKNRGIERLEKSGQYINLRQQVNDAIVENLKNIGKDDITDQFMVSHIAVEGAVNSDNPDEIKRIVDADEEETLPLLIELLVRGRMGTIKKVLDVTTLKRSTVHFNVQRTIVRGMLAYVTGDYEDTVRVAEEATKKAEETNEAWMKSVARSTYMLSTVFLNRDSTMDVDYEIRKTIEDANKQCEESRKNGLYWRGMANMQAATAYWHLMRRVHPQLGGEPETHEFAMAVKYYHAAIDDFEEIGEEIFRAYALNSLGHLMRLQNEIEISLGYYSQALAISDKNKNIRGQLGFAHGMAGWLGWLQEKHAFTQLMSTVESLYLIQWNTMIPPIRNEYDAMWMQWGGVPAVEKPDLKARAQGAMLKESDLLRRAVKQAKVEAAKIPSLFAMKLARD